MNKIKVCFVGLGSIAKRHILNLKDICDEGNIQLQVDILRSSNREVDEEISAFVSDIYHIGENIPDNYDVIFITNPTEFHIDTLKALHNKSRDFFIEKPLTSYKKLECVYDISYRRDSIYYVACPLRYTNVIRYLKENLDISKVIAVRCISSSYLPDWRPGIDYRETYSAHKDLGGGVSIDLIHEWDYIQFLFGKPYSIYYSTGKHSSLEVDCEDYALYIAEYEDMTVELHLDYFGRKTLREIMIITDSDTIVGDLVESKVKFLKECKEIDFSEKRNDYQKRELQHFLKLIERQTDDGNSIEEAYYTMQYTQGVVK